MKKNYPIRRKRYNQNFKFNFRKFLKLVEDNKNAGNIVGGYYPYNYEFDVLQILKNFEKNNFLISLPRIRENFKMDFYQWTFKEPLSINDYGIPEPMNKKKVIPNILLIPLVAFDRELNRLGYGGGFYDRYLSKIKNNKKILKIGAGFSFQKVNKIPVDKHDMNLDYIITEKNIF